MAEHAETFLSLYGADMDAGLQAQPSDSWNSFPLFQLLNNFLRSSGEWRLTLAVAVKRLPSPANLEDESVLTRRPCVNVQRSRAR